MTTPRIRLPDGGLDRVLWVVVLTLLGLAALGSLAGAQTAPPGLDLLRGPTFGVTARNDVATVWVPRRYGPVALPDQVSVTLRLAACPGATPGRLLNLERPGHPPEFRLEHAPAVKALARPPAACGLRMAPAVEAPLPRAAWTRWGPLGDRVEWSIPYPADLRGTGLGVQVLVTWTDEEGVLRGLYSEVMGVRL